MSKLNGLFGLIILLGLSFAVNSSTNSTNSTFFVFYGDCLTDSTTNNTFCSVIPLLNSTLNLNFSQNIIDIQNRTLIAPSLQKYNVSLILNGTKNESYNNTEANITISSNAASCPIAIDCRQNVSMNLNYRDRFVNDACNISLRAPDLPYNNVTKTLAYGERWDLPSEAIYITAPPPCSDRMYNQTLTPTFGNSMMVREANITCTAPEFPAINKNDTIYPNETRGYGAQYNFSISALACKEGYNFVPPNANCTTNRSFALDNNVTVIFCADSVRTICSDTEILDGNFLGCINRLTFDLNESRSNYLNKSLMLEAENQKKQNIIEGWDAVAAVDKSRGDTERTWIVGIMIVFALAGIASLVIRMNKRKEAGIQ